MHIRRISTSVPSLDALRGASPSLGHSSNLRKYILITLSHAESRGVTTEVCCARVRSLFPCLSVIVAVEGHVAHGYHYHIGVKNMGASRKTATKEIRKCFPEFEGHQCNVSFHKGWNTICQYVLKQDKSPLCWGVSLEEVTERARASSGKKQGPDLFKRLQEKNSWEEVLSDESLGNKCLTSYSSMYNTFMDLQAKKEKEHFFSRLSRYVQLNPCSDYTSEDLKEKWEVVDWLVFNLCRTRYIRQPQLLIVGKPNTNKTNFVQCLSEFLDVFFVPLRPDDFSGASNSDDLWVIDEFRDSRLCKSTLLTILDGQKVRLDGKYKRLFEKRRNIPIIMITNSSKWLDETYGTPFWGRVQVLESTTHLEGGISANRLALTLYNRSKEFLILEHGASFVARLEGLTPCLLLNPVVSEAKDKVDQVIYVSPTPGVICLGESRVNTVLFFPYLEKRRGRPKKWVNPANVVSANKK